MDDGQARRRVGQWLGIWAVMLLVAVVIGGITRLTDSGLSITEWKPVTGVVPPMGEAAWREEFGKYQRIPEYRLEHPTMDLAGFKRIYLWEYFHRLWARIVGLALVIPMAIFWWRRRLDAKLKRRVVVILALTGLQGALGWFMVRSGLTVRTDVSQYRLAAHLGLAFGIIALTVATAARLLIPTVTSGSSRLRAAAIGWTALVFTTAIAGAFVAGLDAGKIYNEFPLMGGRVVPMGYGRLSPWWANLFDNVIAVQFNHRLLAWLTAVLGLGLGLVVARRKVGGVARWSAGAIVAMVVIQFLLGVLTLLRSVPIPLAASHQAGAVVLFGLGVVLAKAVDGPP